MLKVYPQAKQDFQEGWWLQQIYTANVLSAEFTDECLGTKSKDN